MIPLRDINPTRKTPVVTYWLIAVNCLVFLFQLSLGPRTGQQLVLVWGLTPALLSSLHPHAFLTILTSMFMHGGWLHIISNMWSLYIFGDNVEDRIGRGRFLLFYLVCGAAAALGQTLFGPTSRVPMVGASGAIAGVMAAYLRLFPHARVLTLVPLLFVFVVELPAVFFIVFWFVLQLMSAVGSLGQMQMGGVAFFAHVGGFLAGLYLLRLFHVRPNPTRGFRPPRRHIH